MKTRYLVLLLTVAAALQHHASGQALRNRIDTITDGLVARFGPKLLDFCPNAPMRLAILNCTGCSWDSPGATAPQDSCGIEESIRVYDVASLRSVVFAALVVGTLLTFLTIPTISRDKKRQPKPVGRGAVEVLRIRARLRERAELARLWIVFFCANFFFAFFLSYIVLCETSITAQVHDATVLTVQIGLLAYTLHRYFAPIRSQMRRFRVSFYTSSPAFIGWLGAVLLILLPLLVVASWLLARRFSDSGNLIRVLPGRFSNTHYNLCYLNAVNVSKDARASTALQYLKGILQLLSAIIFLLGGFTIPWVLVRVLNLAAVYGLLVAQIYVGRPVLRVTGPVHIISEALAFDFVEISVAHLFAVFGLFEVLEHHLAAWKSRREGNLRDMDVAHTDVDQPERNESV
jgi:hypothetical protein